MKGKQLALLLAACLVLGAVWLNSSKTRQASWAETPKGGGKVMEFALNDVSKILIKSPSGELNLVKKDDVWSVQERDYAANFEQVRGLLRKLWDLKTVQEVKVGASQFARLDLQEPGSGENAGTLVQFYAADGKDLGSLLLGKKHMRKSEGGMDLGFGGEGFPSGRYVKPSGSSKVSLISETLDEVDTTATRWLSTDFIHLSGPKSVAVKGEHTWSLSKGAATEDWKLADAKEDEKVDASKVSSLGNILSTASIADVLAADAKLEAVVTAKIDTFDGFHYEIQIGKEEASNRPVTIKVSADIPKERTPAADEKPEDKARLDSEFTAKQTQLSEQLTKEKAFEGRVYLVSQFQVDALLKERKALLAEPPAPPQPPAESAPAPAPAPQQPKQQ